MSRTNVVIHAHGTCHCMSINLPLSNQPACACMCMCTDVYDGAYAGAQASTGMHRGRKREQENEDDGALEHAGLSNWQDDLKRKVAVCYVCEKGVPAWLYVWCSQCNNEVHEECLQWRYWDGEWWQSDACQTCQMEWLCWRFEQLTLE